MNKNESRQQGYHKELDDALGSLSMHFDGLVRGGRIEPGDEMSRSVGMDVHASGVIQGCEELLVLIGKLKRDAVLGQVDRVNVEVAQTKKDLVQATHEAQAAIGLIEEELARMQTSA